MKKLVAGCMMALMVCTFAAMATAQEEEETDYSFGTVKSIAGDQLTVSEYDYEADQDVDVIYTVHPEATLENVTKLTDIAADDSIEIDFITKDGKKVAKAISVEKPLPEEEEV